MPCEKPFHIASLLLFGNSLALDEDMLKHCLRWGEALPLGQSRPSELTRKPGQQMGVRRRTVSGGLRTCTIRSSGRSVRGKQRGLPTLTRQARTVAIVLCLRRFRPDIDGIRARRLAVDSSCRGTRRGCLMHCLGEHLLQPLETVGPTLARLPTRALADCDYSEPLHPLTARGGPGSGWRHGSSARVREGPRNGGCCQRCYQ